MCAPGYLSPCRFFHCRRVVCACSAGAVGSFSNKPHSPKPTWGFFFMRRPRARATAVPETILRSAHARLRGVYEIAEVVRCGLVRAWGWWVGGWQVRCERQLVLYSSCWVGGGDAAGDPPASGERRRGEALELKGIELVELSGCVQGRVRQGDERREHDHVEEAVDHAG